jgi:acyl carrier protein
MMRDAALAYRFVEERLGIDLKSADAAAELAALGVDSLALLELMFEIEDRLGLHIGENTTPPRTCGELTQLLERLAAPTPAAGGQ